MADVGFAISIIPYACFLLLVAHVLYYNSQLSLNNQNMLEKDIIW